MNRCFRAIDSRISRRVLTLGPEMAKRPGLEVAKRPNSGQRVPGGRLHLVYEGAAGGGTSRIRAEYVRDIPPLTFAASFSAEQLCPTTCGRAACSDQVLRAVATFSEGRFRNLTAIKIENSCITLWVRGAHCDGPVGLCLTLPSTGVPDCASKRRFRAKKRKTTVVPGGQEKNNPEQRAETAADAPMD